MTARSNWGRWGDDDQRGAANLAGPAELLRAVSLVRQGKVCSLALPIDGRQPLAEGRGQPQHFMTMDGGDFAAGLRLPGDYGVADDHLSLGTGSTTHVDGLAHIWSGDLLYNAFPATMVGSTGARRLAIDRLRHLVGRGVQVDLARHRESGWLEPGEVVSVADVTAALDGIEVGPGDVVLFRTGWVRCFHEAPEIAVTGEPGIGLEVAEWLLEHDVAAAGADNLAVEARFGGAFEDGRPEPCVHLRLLRDNGVYLIELMDLDELSTAGVKEFLFMAAPLRLVRGVASPLNPLAVY